MELIYVALPLQFAILLGVVLAFSSSPKGSWTSHVGSFMASVYQVIVVTVGSLWGLTTEAEQELPVVRTIGVTPFDDFELKTNPVNQLKTSQTFPVDTDSTELGSNVTSKWDSITAILNKVMTCLSIKVSLCVRNWVSLTVEAWKSWERKSSRQFDLDAFEMSVGMAKTVSSERPRVVSLHRNRSVTHRRQPSPPPNVVHHPFTPQLELIKRKISQKLTRIDLTIFRAKRGRPLRSIEELP